MGFINLDNWRNSKRFCCFKEYGQKSEKTGQKYGYSWQTRKKKLISEDLRKCVEAFCVSDNTCSRTCPGKVECVSVKMYSKKEPNKNI